MLEKMDECNVCVLGTDLCEMEIFSEHLPTVYVIVMSQYKYDIRVIAQHRGGAEYHIKSLKIHGCHRDPHALRRHELSEVTKLTI